jgi:phosphatidylserine/phosphatidylglycerophosphate/cardiolipin synthase-like enzyme
MFIESDLHHFLKEKVPQIKHSITIVSAYVTTEAFKFVENNLSAGVQQKVIVFRGEMRDFQQESSSFNFEWAVEKGWKVFLNKNLHMKNYIFDDEIIVLGSSNLTSAGIGLLDEQVNNLESNYCSVLTLFKRQEIIHLIESSQEFLKSHLIEADQWLNGHQGSLASTETIISHIENNRNPLSHKEYTQSNAYRRFQWIRIRKNLLEKMEKKKYVKIFFDSSDQCPDNMKIIIDLSKGFLECLECHDSTSKEYDRGNYCFLKNNTYYLLKGL